MFSIIALSVVVAVMLYALARALFARPGGGYRHNANLLDRQMSLLTIRQLTWNEFEGVTAEMFRRQGYQVRQRGGTKDGGVDVEIVREGKRFLVQCKRWRNTTVGEPEIRNLVGAVTIECADGGIFVSTGRLTKPAFMLARKAGIDVINGRKLQQMVLDVQDAKRREELIAVDAGIKCPSCGSSMVRRSGKGRRAFWGCSTYPQCRSTRPA